MISKLSCNTWSSHCYDSMEFEICPWWETSMLLSVNLFFPSVPGSFFPWEFLLNDVGEGTPSSIGPFDSNGSTDRIGLQNGDIFGWHFVHAISMDHIILVTWPKTKSRHFPTIFGRLFDPKNGIQNEFKIPKITKHKKKNAKLFNPRSSHVVVSDRVLIDLKIHFRIDTHIACFCLGKTSNTWNWIIFENMPPPPQKKKHQKPICQTTYNTWKVAQSLNLGSLGYCFIWTLH